MDFSVRCSPLKTIVSRKVISLFHISAVDVDFLGWDLLVSLIKSWSFLLQSQRKETSSMKCSIKLVFMLHWVCFSLHLVDICKGQCLCPMQLPGFEDNCFHWTQISFLSLRMRPSILWGGPGYNYTESSSSHQCVRILSCRLIYSNYFFLFATIIF